MGQLAKLMSYLRDDNVDHRPAIKEFKKQFMAEFDYEVGCNVVYAC